MTTCRIIGMFFVLYLIVLILRDYLGASLDTTVGVWAIQVKNDIYEFMVNYRSLSMAIDIAFVLLFGVLLPYISHNTWNIITRTTSLKIVVHWNGSLGWGEFQRM